MEHESAPTEFKTEDVPKSIEDGHTYGDKMDATFRTASATGRSGA